MSNEKIIKYIKSNNAGAVLSFTNKHSHWLITISGGYYDIIAFDDVKELTTIERSIYSVTPLIELNSSDFVLHETSINVYYLIPDTKFTKVTTPFTVYREGVKLFYLPYNQVQFLLSKKDTIYFRGGYWLGDTFVESGEVIKNFSRGSRPSMLLVDNKYEISSQYVSKHAERFDGDTSSRQTHAILNSNLWKGECCDNIKFQGVVEPYFDVRIADKLGYSEKFIQEWVDEINKLFDKEVVTVTKTDGKFTKIFKEVYRFKIRHSYHTLNYLALIMVRYFWYGPFNQIPRLTMDLLKKGELDFFQSLCKIVCENDNSINDMNFIARNTYYAEVENVNFDLFQKEWREREKGFTNLLKDLKKLQNGN